MALRKRLGHRQLLSASQCSSWRQMRGITYRIPQQFAEDMASTSLVLVREARRFVQECFSRVGMSMEKQRCITDLLLAADYRGVHGSGINRLDMYLSDIQNGYVDIKAEPRLIHNTLTTAHVDGNRAMGVFVANYCMDLAVEKARQTGIGFVVAKQSHHIGMAAWYAFRAVAKGFIGLVMSNAAPMMMQPGCRSSSLGANCLAFGATGNWSHLMLDMSTTVRDIGAIEWAFMNQEQIPRGWASDVNGMPTTFPNLALSAQQLYPIGGNKGFSLAAMIDVLCGVMSGADYATRIPRWCAPCQGRSPNLGLVMLVLDPCFFVPNFKERLDDFNRRIRNSCPRDEANPVKVPGDLEKQHMDYVDDLGALPYPNLLLAKCKLIANMLCVKPMQLAFTSCERHSSCLR
ncbi:uncharacterized oxidoreductase YjmC [Drosophila sulfurigaster albostrigata]|uniref:uncharacterized oxidoreductase YjmC n=1 Tax=Drosophila sulfurigaster albostrigata TaxID=89887 RepID=UPI002D21B995|nr:uncharacterized oxidoreductase YjmC [Drosophila sulfurigaster albostrigata]